MKKAIFIVLILYAFNLNAQNYDLIVKANGDSIACQIDSITDSKVYFEMKYNNNWIHTVIDKYEIIEYKYDVVNKKLAVFKSGSSYIDQIRKPANYTDKVMYANRYLFGPSAFGIDKSMKSYTNYNIFVQDFQFGISDRFSLGAGTSIILNPVYIMPTYTYQINDKSALAVGDLFLFTTYDNFVYGNLFYGLYTRGSLDNNFTIGVGLWTSIEGKDETETIDPDMNPSFIEYNTRINTVSPAFNFSTQLKLSSNLYFISENYGLKLNMSPVAELKEDNSSYGEITVRSEHFAREETIVAGILGLRIINKKNPLKSWQISAVYIFAKHEEIPDKYKQPGWETYDNGKDYSFIPIPLISYSIKF
ncbi:MAG: hypothetical protein JEY96_06075 [Bacteroidales bacterium]|nr:hypothetical protein [Bacteroidales bacterium]